MAVPAWSDLHARLHQLLKARQLLPAGQRLLVAVSGGQDSLCLIRLLLDLQPKWGWQLGIVHCDHGWRPDSQANADHVAALAWGWQIPFYGQRATTVTTTEAAARQWRYQVLADTAIHQRYAIVVTGHTASDRAETLLYNLLRGSGSDGLQALQWQRPLVPGVTLVRPLLELFRTDTARFCQDRGLPVWTDTTNGDWHYQRNRIREELLPYLREHFNPQVERHLAQTAELLRGDVGSLEVFVDQLYHKSRHPQVPALQVLPLRPVDLGLQRRVVRRFLREFLSHHPSFKHVEKVTALIRAPGGTQTDPLPGGAVAKVKEDWIYLLG